MGCDIHEYVEVRGEDGRWRVIGERREDPTYPGEFEFFGGPLDIDRNYNLFAILADVRNGRGFAGCDTGNRLTPIADPRGLPEDCDPVTRAESDRWGCDGHSHSWATLAELLAYDWTQTVTHRGYVNGPEFSLWSQYDKGRGESPKSYSGDVFGGMVVKVAEPELAAKIKAIESAVAADSPGGNWWPVARKRIAEELGSTYAQVAWEQPYYKSVRRFLSDAIPVMLRLGKPEDVRLVFWFDN